MPLILIVVLPLPRVVHTAFNVLLKYKFLGRSLSCVASFTSSSDVKLLPFREYFRGHENRWLPHLVIIVGGVTPQFEILNICFMVWRAAVWGRSGVVMLQTHSRRQATPLSSNWLLKLIPNHITIHFTVPCLFLLQVMFILRILYNFSGFRFIDLCLYRLTSDVNTIAVRVETLCNSM
jgi:hypothetical protein